MDAYQEGINAYLTLSYDTPIHAIAKHDVRMGKDDRTKFAAGFWHAHRTLK